MAERQTIFKVTTYKSLNYRIHAKYTGSKNLDNYYGTEQTQSGFLDETDKQRFSLFLFIASLL